VLTIEVNLDAYKLAKKNDLSTTMYHELMMDNSMRWSTKEWRLWMRLRDTNFILPELRIRR